MGFSIIAKTAIQKTPALGINLRTVVQPHVYYTCPAGKVAKVRGTVVCTGRGAAAEGRFLINGTITFRWRNDVVNLGMAVPTSVSQVINSVGTRFDPPILVYQDFEFTLNAGEDFSTDQSSGTNAEFNVFAEILESPA